MQGQQTSIKKLISKIDAQNGSQQVKQRCINNLHNKIQSNLLPSHKIHLYPQLPGTIMKWINTHFQTKNQYLKKVLIILSHFTKTQQALTLLYQYQTLQFLQPLRKYIIQHYINSDLQIQTIQQIIRKLIPYKNKTISNYNQTNHQSDQNDPQNNCISLKDQSYNKQIQKQSKSLIVQKSIATVYKDQKSSTIKTQKQKKYEKAKQLQLITINFINRKQPVSEEQQKKIFDLTVQLKYGKKQLQYQTLMQIRRFLLYNSKKTFKSKIDLIQQLCLYAQTSCYPWLACEILNIIIKGIFQNQSQSQFHNWQYTLFQSQNWKILQKSKEVVTFDLKTGNQSIFSCVYSIQILITLAKTLKIQDLPYLCLIKSPHCYVHFIQVLKRLPQQELAKPNIISSIQYYSATFPQCNVFLVPFIKDQSKIKSYQTYLKRNELKFSYDKYLRKYMLNQSKIQKIEFSNQIQKTKLKRQQFKLSQNLHNMKQILQDLQNGIEGINYNPVQVIQKLYIDAFLLMVVAVEKKDPLKSNYHRLRTLLLKLSIHPYKKVRQQFYNSLLKCLYDNKSNLPPKNSSIIKQNGLYLQYMDERYLRSQLFERSLEDPQFLNGLFQNSLNQSYTTYCMLQIIKIIQTKYPQHQNYLGKCVSVFYSLIFYDKTESLNKSHNLQIKNHQEQFLQKISVSANTILSRLPKKYQFKTLLMQLFSKDINTRCNMAKQLLSLKQQFKGSSQTLDFIQQLVYKIEDNNNMKKTLKIQQSSIRNFINYAMDSQLDWNIRSQAFNNLINSLKRAEINHQLANTLNQLSKGISQLLQSNLKYALGQKQDNTIALQMQLICIQLYGLILEKLYVFLNQNKLQNNQDVLQINFGAKIISEQMILCLLSKIVHSKLKDYSNNAIGYLLKMLYFSVFQSPFSSQPIKHWTADIYSHHNVVQNYLLTLQKNQAKFKQCHNDENRQNFEINNIVDINQCKNFKAYVQKVLKIAIKNNCTPIDIDFASIQRQIMQGIGCNSISQGVDALSLVAYFLQRIDKQTLPNDAKNLTSQILNALFVRQKSQSFGFETDTIRVLRQLNKNGIKNSRQMQSLIQSSSSVNLLTKIKLLQLLVQSKQIFKIEQIQQFVVKSMKNGQNDQLLLSLKLFDMLVLDGNNLANNLFTKMSDFSQLQVLNIISKCLKSKNDIYLKQCSLFILSKILKSLKTFNFNGVIQGQLNLLLSTVCDNILQGTINDKDEGSSNSFTIYMRQFIMGIDCAKRIIQKQFYLIQSIYRQSSNSNNANQIKSLNNMIRIILVKLISLLKKTSAMNTTKASNANNTLIKSQIIFPKCLNLLRASIFSFMTHLINIGAADSLKQIDVIDIAVQLLGQLKQPNKQQFYMKNKKNFNLQLYNKNIKEYLIQISQICNFLFKWKNIQPQLNQYLLSSTDTLKYLLSIFNFINSIVQSETFINQTENIFKSTIKVALDKIGCLLLQLSKKSVQDLFVIKMSKLLKNYPQLIKNDNIFQYLAKFCKYGGRQYLKFYSWLSVIQWKGRSVLDYQDQNQKTLGQKVMQIFIKRKCIYESSSLVAMSTGAKKTLIQSQQFSQLVKKVNSFIDNKVVQGMKNKKKNIKASNVSYLQNDQSQIKHIIKTGTNNNSRQSHTEINSWSQQIKNILLLLCSLFHSPQQKIITSNSLKVPKPLGKKLFSIIQKLYTFMTNNSVPNNYDQNPEQHQRISKYFIKMITNLSQSKQLGQFFSAHISQNNSFMLEDICNTIIKSQILSYTNQKIQKNTNNNNNVKQALMILGLFGKHQTARNLISRMKIIQDLNGRLCRLIQDPRRDVINGQSMQQIYWIIQFYVQLSEFKETNAKMMMEKRVLQSFIVILSNEKFTFHLLQRQILHLIQNLCCFKQNKSLFLSNKQVHKILLYLLQYNLNEKMKGRLECDQSINIMECIISIIYNLVYKSSGALKIYKRQEVLDLIKDACQIISNQNEVDNGDIDNVKDKMGQVRKSLLQALIQN